MGDRTLSMSQVVPIIVGGVAAGVTVGVLIGKYLLPVPAKVNLTGIDKDNVKVVHAVDVEDITDKKAFCRCWRSKEFPYCDGSHNAHNDVTGDNVGPLIVKKNPQQ